MQDFSDLDTKIILVSPRNEASLYRHLHRVALPVSSHSQPLAQQQPKQSLSHYATWKCHMQFGPVAAGDRWEKR